MKKDQNGFIKLKIENGKWEGKGAIITGDVVEVKSSQSLPEATASIFSMSFTAVKDVYKNNSSAEVHKNVSMTYEGEMLFGDLILDNEYFDLLDPNNEEDKVFYNIITGIENIAKIDKNLSDAYIDYILNTNLSSGELEVHYYEITRRGEKARAEFFMTGVMLSYEASIMFWSGPSVLPKSSVTKPVSFSSGSGNGFAIRNSVASNFAEHAFANGRHSDLGLSTNTMVSKGLDLVIRNSASLQAGNNTLIGTINGVQKSFKVFVKDGVIMSINMYPGVSNRVTQGAVINYGNVLW